MELVNIDEIKTEGKPIEEKKIDFDKLHDEYLVDLAEELKPQPVAISIGESEFKGNLYPNPVCSYGDFSCIVGESKAKKSFLKSLLVARYIGGYSQDYAPEIVGYLSDGKYVIDIDTEQGPYHSQKTFRRVGYMERTNSNLYKPFRLRPLSPTQRLQFIDWIFNESMYKNNIGLLVIDGIADLIHDINNIEESTMIVQKLMTWTEKSNCHIINVLHLNPGSDKPKGHLGTFVMQKAESIIRVKREDSETSSVTADYARNRAFDSFEIKINNGLPYYCNELSNMNKQTSYKAGF